jgi:hypothetical protein
VTIASHRSWRTQAGDDEHDQERAAERGGKGRHSRPGRVDQSSIWDRCLIFPISELNPALFQNYPLFATEPFDFSPLL